MELNELKVKYKGKVPSHFWKLLDAFDQDKYIKIGPDTVLNVSSFTSLWQGELMVALKKVNTLTLHWGSKVSTTCKAQALADFYNIPWSKVVDESVWTDGTGTPYKNWMGSIVESVVSPTTKPSPVGNKVFLTFEIKEEKAKAPASKPFILADEPVDDKIQELWGLDTNYLLPVAADFYLLAEASLNQPWVKWYYQKHARRTAELVAGYLAMAIGGELRHSRTRPDWMKGLTNGSRKRAWEDWRKIWDKEGPVRTCEFATESFRRASNWRNSSYGGPAWSKAAELLGEWFSNELNDVLFVDTAMQLQHNTGCIFNKWFLDLSNLMRLLNAKFEGNHAVLLPYASEPVRRMFLNSLPKDREEDKVRWAKQFNVSRVIGM